jgi:CRP/FNR family transcriptional regulator
MNEKLWKLHFPEFIGSVDKVIKQLMDSAVLVNLPARQQVFYPGKVCDNYLLMLSGSIKAQIMSADGREILLYHVHAGDSCVLTTSCLLGDNNYPAEGFTETEVSAFAIPAHVFHRCLEQSTFFREFVFRNFSKRLADVIKRMESISFGTVDQKLAKALLASGEKNLHKTHNELALELGSAREVVSRHLKRFESYGWLTLSRGSIQNINFDALNKILDAGDSH